MKKIDRKIFYGKEKVFTILSNFAGRDLSQKYLASVTHLRQIDIIIVGNSASRHEILLQIDLCALSHWKRRVREDQKSGVGGACMQGPSSEEREECNQMKMN